MKILRVISALLLLGLTACDDNDYGTTPNTTIPSLGTPEENEIWFTTTDERGLFAMDPTAFNTEIEDIEYATDYGMSIIRFKGTLTTILDDAFNGCTNLSNISFPNTVTKIGKRAFFDCRNMECMTLGTGLRSCDSLAFDNCINLHSLHISSIVDWCKISFESKTANPAYYSQTLLADSEKIRQLNIYDKITSISKFAFCDNIYIDTVVVPASVQSIGEDAFDGCTNLAKVDIENITKWCSIEFGNENANPLSMAKSLYSNGAAVTNLSIDNAESISAQAFINCSAIRTLTIGNATKKIGAEAFRACPSLAEVTLGESITEIEGRAFMGCDVLNKVTCYAVVPPTLADKYVFSYNAKERKIYVPGNALDAYKEAWSEYSDSIVAIE